MSLIGKYPFQQKQAVLASDLNLIAEQTIVYGVDSGASNSIVLSLPRFDFVDYFDGMVVRFKANATNSGPTTININGKGAKSIKKYTGEDLTNEDIVSGKTYEIYYNGTNFQLGTSKAEDGSIFKGVAQENLVSGEIVKITPGSTNGISKLGQSLSTQNIVTSTSDYGWTTGCSCFQNIYGNTSAIMDFRLTGSGIIKLFIYTISSSGVMSAKDVNGYSIVTGVYVTCKPECVYDPVNNRILLTYFRDSDKYPMCVVVKYDGTNVTVGTPVVIDSQLGSYYGGNILLSYDYAQKEILIISNDQRNGYNGPVYHACSISDMTPTVGTGVVDGYVFNVTSTLSVYQSDLQSVVYDKASGNHLFVACVPSNNTIVCRWVSLNGVTVNPADSGTYQNAIVPNGFVPTKVVCLGNPDGVTKYLLLSALENFGYILEFYSTNTVSSVKKIVQLKKVDLEWLDKKTSYNAGSRCHPMSAVFDPESKEVYIQYLMNTFNIPYINRYIYSGDGGLKFMGQVSMGMVDSTVNCSTAGIATYVNWYGQTIITPYFTNVYNGGASFCYSFAPSVYRDTRDFALGVTKSSATTGQAVTVVMKGVAKNNTGVSVAGTPVFVDMNMTQTTNRSPYQIGFVKNADEIIVDIKKVNY